MILKLVGLLFLFNCFCINSQNTDHNQTVEGMPLSDQLYTKCFENLNQGSEIFEKYASLKNMKFCSLLECMFLFSCKEEDIKRIAEQRLIGIATQLYNAGTPVYLIMGLDSYLNAKKKNENLEDDNHIVYIDYGECTNPPFLIEAAAIVNKQTNLLVNQPVGQ
ncbi:hypothetical protein [Flavobacterium foetidum]|uniref:hypothetical protein n=1 Tax=Flavobacterium foetidum TaxID=2026681 RepID=UPI0010750C9A|nr:hypothetical protein [Flavobacterium foetidum]KAF2513932.1 hypothetical protein E0W73_13980 [Flavobacterium foetidum]